MNSRCLSRVELVVVVEAGVLVAVVIAPFSLDVSPPALGASPDVYPLFPSAFLHAPVASVRACLP
jgi:membrane associated rhomboid family serine protease